MVRRVEITRNRLTEVSFAVVLEGLLDDFTAFFIQGSFWVAVYGLPVLKHVFEGSVEFLLDNVRRT